MLTEDKKIYHVYTFLDVFLKLVKNTDSNINSIRFKMVLLLISDLLKILTVVYTIITKFVAPVLIPWYAEIVLQLLMTCAPCVSLEIAVNDLEEIKFKLVEKLLMYKDLNLWTLLLQAVDYIESCTAGLTLWNTFAMDMKLVLGVFNVCASYIIALLQFAY